MWRLLLAVVLLAACGGADTGAAIVACEEFVTREVGDVDFTDTDVTDRGEGVYRVTGTVVSEFSEHPYECQVRRGGGEWTLEMLRIDD